MAEVIVETQDTVPHGQAQELTLKHKWGGFRDSTLGSAEPSKAGEGLGHDQHVGANCYD